jgi:hypothetical protein
MGHRPGAVRLVRDDTRRHHKFRRERTYLLPRNLRRARTVIVVPK